MTIRFFENRVNVSFNVELKGNAYVQASNDIYRIANNFCAQTNIMCNKSPFIKDKNENDIPQMGSFGGAITFHEAHCNPREAYKELVAYLKPYTYSIKYEKELVKTHRADGSPYKRPQTIIVSCDENENILENV